MQNSLSANTCWWPADVSFTALCCLSSRWPRRRRLQKHGVRLSGRSWSGWHLSVVLPGLHPPHRSARLHPHSRLL